MSQSQEPPEIFLCTLVPQAEPTDENDEQVNFVPKASTASGPPVTSRPFKRPKLPRRKRKNVKFDPTLQHKWTRSEANHLYDNLEELEQKVTQCLQNQTLIYKLVQRVEELDEKFREFVTGGPASFGKRKMYHKPLTQSITPTAPVTNSEQDIVSSIPEQTNNQSRFVILTTSYNPTHSSVAATMTTQIQLQQSQNDEMKVITNAQQPHSKQSDEPEELENDHMSGGDQNEEQEDDEEADVYEVIQMELEDEDEGEGDWTTEQRSESLTPGEEELQCNPPVQVEYQVSTPDSPLDSFQPNWDPFGDQNQSLIEGSIDGSRIENLDNLENNRKSRNCPICNKFIISTWGLNRHMLAVHSIGKPLECKACSQKFTKRDALQMHQFQDHGKPLPPDARKVIKEGKVVTRRVTSKDIHYECVTCTLTFPSDQAMQEHKKKEHPYPNRPFRCQLCLTDEFYDKEGMQDHVLKMHPIRGTTRIGGNCPVCGTASLTKWHLNRHMISKHGIGEPKVCSICGEQFARKYRLRLHQIRDHGTMSEDLDAKGPQGPWICPECNKEFKCKSTMDGHLPGCRGLKPFLCDECGQGFAHRSGVRQHKLSFHAQIKNHFCPVCEKGFFDLGHYKRHVQIHSEDDGKGTKRRRRSSIKAKPKLTTPKHEKVEKHEVTEQENYEENSTGKCFRAFSTVGPGNQPVEVIEVYIPEGTYLTQD